MASGKFAWGQLIVQLRREKGFSQRRLAEVAEVNRFTLDRLEKGQASVKLEVVESVLSVLGYELEAIKIPAPICSPENSTVFLTE